MRTALDAITMALQPREICKTLIDMWTPASTVKPFRFERRHIALVGMSPIDFLVCTPHITAWFLALLPGNVFWEY